MRSIPSPLAASLALALAACGGGGGTGGLGGLPGAGALLKGNVVSVNGQSSNVSGVTLRAPSSGAVDVSDSFGTFDLGRLPPGLQVIGVKTSRGSEVEIEIEVEDGGVVSVRLSVDDDGVARVGEDHCDDDGSRAEARAALTPEEPGLEGHVKVRKDDDGDQGFDVEAEELELGRLVDVVVIDPATGDEETLARLTAQADDDGDDGAEAELELRTSDGDRLPFNVQDVAELADMRVEVRDALTGLAILSGDVPSIGSVPSCRDDNDDDDGDGDDDGDDDSDGDGDDDSGDDRSGEARLANLGQVSGQAQVELRSRPGRNEQKIEIEVDGSNAVGTLEAWLEDPANPGTLVQVGLLTPEDDGELEYERDTSDGESLPFGVATAADLVGLAVEVRRASDGAVLFAGTTPPLRID